MARWSRFRRLFGPEPKADVDAELSFHVEMRMRELIDQGVPADQARTLALSRFGDYDSSRGECVAISERRGKRMARLGYLTELRQDVGYALRMLRRAPGFTLVALTTLALGIGATSAIFSVVHGVLLAPLPYREADRLYRVTTLYPDGTAYSLSAPDFMSVREQARALEQVDAFSDGVYTMLGAGEPREVRGAYVSDGLFDLLGLRVSIGRALLPGDNQPGHNAVTVLDHGFWLRQFGGDPRVLGRTITIAGAPLEIVGVLAPDARLLDEMDLYAPLTYTQTFSASTANGRRAEFLTVVGRATPGAGLAQVEEDLRRVGTDLQGRFRETNEALTFNATSLDEVVLGDVRRPLFVLLGAVGFVLLVACANVANLLLARASARQAELAVRSALGAGRARLLRQLLTEALVLGAAGAVAGLGIAYLATRTLVAMQPADLPRLEEVGLNGVVVAFTLGIALATSLTFGILPALQFSGRRLPSVLRESTRGGTGGGHRLRAALVVAEMALAVVLLTGAGLLIRSFIELTRVDPGFRPEQALSLRVTLQSVKYREDAPTRLRVAEFEERLRALPGVNLVATTSVLPLSGRGAMVGFAVEGAPPPPPNVNAEIAMASVTPDYFRAIGAAVRRGRQFSDQDHADARRVAIINEAGVRRWFDGQDPLGRRVNTDGVLREVIGVAADVRQRSPAEPTTPMVFVPFAQRTIRSVKLVVRTTGDPVPLAAAIRQEIRALDPDLAVADITPLTQVVARSLTRPRFYTRLLALFAAVALVLAATGVFGVMSYAVAQRARKDITIRMALGAVPRDVLRMFVGRALGLSAAGVGLGLAAALVLGRFLQGQLFGVTLLDPLTLGAVSVVLCGSALVASFLPARRATRFDAAGALREG